jgi:hypothetical protein
MPNVEWQVFFHSEFEPEFDKLDLPSREELLAQVHLLRKFGHQLGRPRVDTLNGSEYANMKELRFDATGGVWRVAFAFDPYKNAILLIAGDKSGVSEKRFYQQLIKKADQRFASHLAYLESIKKEKARRGK